MTAVPAALDALVSRFAGSGALQGVLVLDGPWLAVPPEPDVVVVGYSPDDVAAVEYTDTIAGLDSNREQFDVACLALAWRGETVMRTVRDRCDQLVEAMRAELVADPTLGGAVTRARLTTVSLDQDQTEQGAVATAQATVRVDAFRR